MDLRRPLRVVTPTIDGEVLALLAGGELRLTGREIARRIGASQDGVRKVLVRLERQGILHREEAGKAHLYSFNREHIAAPAIEQLASLRLELIRRLRVQVEGWKIHPAAVTLFGSTARGDSDEGSDIDLLVVRPADVDADSSAWRSQLAALVRLATALTGNDTRVAEYSEADALARRSSEPVLAHAAAEGVELFGSVTALWRRQVARGRGPWRRTPARKARP